MGLSWVKGLSNSIFGTDFQLNEGSNTYNYNMGLGHFLNGILPDSVNMRKDMFFSSIWQIKDLIDLRVKASNKAISDEVLRNSLEAIAEVSDSQRSDFVKYLLSSDRILEKNTILTITTWALDIL
ncbi:MAG: hypothetical protein ACD_79C00038G0002 [uncultured bacterium]|nr:MAG: hypothetical protein ACD_79C00038G0002 [uncultured bacterium]